MSIIKDTFFGGAEKKAAKAQQQGIERGIDETRRATEEARQAVIPLFGQARQEANQGFQGALDVFAQSLPAQMQTFQQGNVGAQEQLLAGLPQFQNAILGNQIDFSQLQPAQVQTPDLGFFQQTLPEVQRQQQNEAMNGGLGAFTPNNPVFNGMMGPFQSAVGGASQNAFDGLLNQITTSANRPVNAAPTGAIDPRTGQLNTDFRAFGPNFIARGPGDTPEQQLTDPTGVAKPHNLFALGGF